MKSGIAIVFVFCMIAFTALLFVRKAKKVQILPYHRIFVNDDPEWINFRVFTGATVNIAGVIADVIATQIYKNEGTRPIETMSPYFRLRRAAVYGLTMTIGERTIFAEIRERQWARQEYRQAETGRQNHILTGWERPNIFQMNVANILLAIRFESNSNIRNYSCRPMGFMNLFIHRCRRVIQSERCIRRYRHMGVSLSTSNAGRGTCDKDRIAIFVRHYDQTIRRNPFSR